MAPKAASDASGRKKRSSQSTAAITSAPKKKTGDNSLTRTFSATKATSAPLDGKGKTDKKVASKRGDDDLSDLNEAYPALYKTAKREMGTPIHAEDWDKITTILRVFDANPDFGPCSNQSRLERYDRAVALGLSPPSEIGEILRSKAGRAKPEYANSVFNI